MKTITPILASAAFVIFSTSAMAANDSKKIDIKVNQPTYAVLHGSAVSNSVNNIDIAQITGNESVSFGTLGIKSNGKSCALSFDTDNNFTLVHENDATLVLKKFALNYLGTDITAKTDMPLDSCVTAASAFSFQATGTAPDIIAPGNYKDTVTITLTAE